MMKLRYSSAFLLAIIGIVAAGGFFLLGTLVPGRDFVVGDKVLVFLVLAVGGVALVTVAGIVVLANPLGRLLERVRRVNPGDDLSEGEFTRNLHAEPLALAQRIREIFRGFASQAKTDHLTGLSNRRQFDLELERAFLDARRFCRPLSLIVLDVDLFKAINDTAGHQRGDELLKSVADVLVSCCRKTDLPARLGGDEFAILLPGTAAVHSGTVAGRILAGISGRPVVLDSGQIKATASIGIADLNSGEVQKPQDLLALADRAMYEAKKQWRNRFVLAHVLDEAQESDGREADRVATLQESLAALDGQFKSLFVRALQDIVGTMERRDPHMADHARKVQHLARLIAQEMRLPQQTIQRIELTALLHDVGMLALPDSIALCAGRLSDPQREIMRRHPLIGARILEGTQFLETVIPGIRSHHERFDGRGYPDKLAGQSIPLAARIVAVADIFDAITSPRSFRAAKSTDEAVGEIRGAAGTQLDPHVVEAFLPLVPRLGDPLSQSGQADGQGSPDGGPEE